MRFLDLFRKKTEKSIVTENTTSCDSYGDHKISPPSTPFVIEKDRYDSEKLLKIWIDVDKSNNTIVVDDIEVDDYQGCFDTMMQSFWNNICIIDNYVQEYCANELNVKTESWKVELSWLSVREGELFLAYWGVYMNVELRAVCKYQNDTWNITEIYYC
ncbi:hypothetical protein [Butyrivibrio fibrisolvens]|uniref:hypothetical protein n=1 Tax=Butyrivibrio fibrisolvens TaxID=831 RepID=UPI0003B440C9|nr:hypothetical protein [Butyrivibrio fibrisolvens]